MASTEKVDLDSGVNLLAVPWSDLAARVPDPNSTECSVVCLSCEVQHCVRQTPLEKPNLISAGFVSSTVR